MTADEILKAVQKRVIDLGLFGGLAGVKSRAEIEQQAIDEIAKELKLTSIPKLPTASPNTNDASRQPDDAQTKADAAFMREYFMRDFPIELIEDLHTYTDEQLEELVKSWGFA